MKNLWPEKFEETKLDTASALFQEQGNLLGKITGGIVVGQIEELDDPTSLVLIPGSTEFAFRFDLVGKYANGYRFGLLSFGHDIGLYPVGFYLDDILAKELGNAAFRKVASQEELEKFMETIFNSKRVRNVVGSIMKLSKTPKSAT